MRFDALVIGSGAGGATTAYHLAKAGLTVLIVEEGPDLRENPPNTLLDAMGRQYRRRGMTPILGTAPIGYVEGACVGGSTQINSGFWHRTPREILMRWRAGWDLKDADEAMLRPHFEWAERRLGVGPYRGEKPLTTKVFERGIEAMGWSAMETPRTGQAPDAPIPVTPCGVGLALMPETLASGARLIDRSRVERIVVRGRRAEGAVLRRAVDGHEEWMRVHADAVFVCAGPTETPALLRRSGIGYHVGDTLRIHPMLKVAARYDEPVSARSDALPLVQVKEFWPDVSLGGAFSSPGHVAMVMSENWHQNRAFVAELAHFANFYVAVKGSGAGSVRPNPHGSTSTQIRYSLSEADVRHLSQGFARLAMVLLAGGATAVYPSVHGLPPIRTELEAARWLDDRLPVGEMGLTTVHAFSTCPIGERIERTAASSYGKVHHHDNLYLNDASTLPDSPGVNPQGSVMALARRNVLRFLDENDR